MNDIARRRARRAIGGWWLLGALACTLLPWYLSADKSMLQSLPGAFGGADTASALVQAFAYGKPWLWSVIAGLAICAVGVALPGGQRQGALLVAGAAFGLAGLLGAGFAIGARGWAFEGLDARFGALPAGQFGLGLGGVLALASLLMLLGLGLARRGFFRGDLFVACAVLGCGALLLLFVALPVLRALSGALLDESGAVSLAALYERIGNERVWGFGCLAGGGGRCGVAWNTLYLALLTAAGTTVLGTLIALLAERGSKRLHKPLQGLALLPIITPPFVVGLGLILLFGRAGLVNQALEALFGVTPSR